MNLKDKNILYKLFRDHSDLIGATKATSISLQALVTSIEELETDSIKKEIQELIEVINTSEPKIIPLIHLLEDFNNEMDYSGSFKEVQKLAITTLSFKIGLFNANIKNLVKLGRGEIQDGDKIIVHSPSSVLTKILLECKKRFEVIILKQDFQKTRELINMFEKAKIKFSVIPEYNICHYLDKNTKLFLGALSVTKDLKLLTGVGSASLTSLCHVNKIPIVLFVNSLKFSHKSSIEQKIHKKEENKSHDNCKYCLVTHSHDIVDLKLVNKIYTENGLESLSKLKKYWD